MSLNKTFPFFLVSPVFLSLLCQKYAIKCGLCLLRIGYVLVLYILTEMVYKLKCMIFNIYR